MKTYNKRVRDFNECFEKLPQEIQNKAKEIFCKWNEDSDLVDCKPLEKFDNVIYSCKINLRYRAMAKKVNRDGQDVFLWFWIGSHEDYNNQLQRSLLNLKISEARKKVETLNRPNPNTSSKKKKDKLLQ